MNIRSFRLDRRLDRWKRPVIGALLGVSLLAVLPVRSHQTKSGNVGNPELLGLLTSAYGAEAVALDRGIRDYKMPDQIPWQTRPDGSQIAVLYGDPSKPGFYVQLLKRPPNVWAKSHYHESERYITVLKGTFWVGTGKFDPERTIPLKAGTFVRDFANQIHFDGSKDDGTILEFVGMGPSTSHYGDPPETAASAAKTGPVVIDPTIREIQRPEDMVWKKGNGSATGSSGVVLYGDPSKPGLYVQLNRRDPNNWSQPHSHPTDRFITVMEGTMYLGTGTQLDKDKTLGLTPGGFVRDIANQVHYDGTKDQSMSLLFAGIGPATSTLYQASK